MYKLNPKEVKQEEIFGIIHSYIRSEEWWIIITSNDVMPIIEFRLSESCPVLVYTDIKAWEEPYGGAGKFGALVIIIKHEKTSFGQLNQCFQGSMTKGKDIFAIPSPEHSEYLQQLTGIIHKLSDLMNDLDKRT